MRTKSSAQHISTVIDLTYSQEQQQESPPISFTKQHFKPSVNMGKDAKPAREKNCTTAKVRKAPCSTTAKKPSIKRKRQQNAPEQQQQQQQPTGLYQFDLTNTIRQKLKMLFEQPMMAAHGSSFIPSDPRYGWGAGIRQPTTMRLDPAAALARTTPSYQPCSVPGCSQVAVSAGLSRHHTGRPMRTVVQPSRRFSIFRSVELMAQSSCVSKH